MNNFEELNHFEMSMIEDFDNEFGNEKLKLALELSNKKWKEYFSMFMFIMKTYGFEADEEFLKGKLQVMEEIKTVKNIRD
jgi:hypothetical protein